MKKIASLFLCMFIISQIFLSNTAKAVTAYPHPIEFTQPDGSKITILLKGDEKIRWAETMDGYSLLFNKKGTYEYAVLDYSNNLIPSGRQAKSQSLRNTDDINLLRTIPKGIRYSPAQVQMMKSAWNVYSKEAQSAFPTTGNRSLVCILIGYTDVPFTKTNADFNNLFNQINYTTEGATGSVKDYYLENSYNQLNLTITVAGPYTASNTMAYYGADYNGSHSIRARDLITEAVYAANATVNYADFDNDNDGAVDGVYVIFAGYGQEAGGSADAIWSHASNIQPITLDGKTISKYSCSSELRFNYGEYMTRIGVICHEFGHVLGAPDYYDTDYATSGEYDGTGEWDLMAAGAWNNGGKTPPHHNAYTKTVVYNWAVQTVINSPTQISLDNAAEYSGSFYRYNTNSAEEYYLIENRQNIKFDAFIPGHGMIIYHVDKNFISSGGNSFNTNSHQGMYPVCANANGNAPTVYGIINSGGCPFPGTANKTSFTDSTTPNSKSWAGINTAKPITNISENTTYKTVSFAFMGGFTCTSATIQATNLTFPAKTTASITIATTRGNGNRLLIIAKEGLYVNANLSSGTPYAADTVFGSGQQIGSGNYVVYNGNGNGTTITGLTSGKLYYFACYEFNTIENCYVLPALTGYCYTDYNLPLAAGNISGANNVCNGQNNVTYIVPPITNATYYTWTIPTGATGYSSTNSITVNFGSSAVSGDISVTGTNPTGNGPSASYTIMVNPIPATPIITQNGNQLISDAIQGNQWYITTTPLINATSNFINPVQTGNYFVVVIENGCQSAPSNTIYFSTTAITESNNNVLNTKVYPNPFKEKTTIHYTLTEDENVELTLFDITGQNLIQLLNQKQEKGDHHFVIDAKSLSTGIYFYQLKSGNNLQKGKLILY